MASTDSSSVGSTRMRRARRAARSKSPASSASGRHSIPSASCVSCSDGRGPTQRSPCASFCQNSSLVAPRWRVQIEDRRRPRRPWCRRPARCRPGVAGQPHVIGARPEGVAAVVRAHPRLPAGMTSNSDGERLRQSGPPLDRIGDDGVLRGEHRRRIAPAGQHEGAVPGSGARFAPAACATVGGGGVRPVGVDGRHAGVLSRASGSSSSRTPARRRAGAAAHARLVRRRDGCEQRLRVRMQGVAPDRLGVAGLDDAAPVHDERAVGDAPHHREVVRDEQHPGAGLEAQGTHQGGDAGLGRGVEGRDRLVGDEHPGPRRQRAGDGDALLLPAGELVRVAHRTRVEARRARATRRDRTPTRRGRPPPARRRRSASPTRRRGFSEEFGSWNTICMPGHLGRPAAQTERPARPRHRGLTVPAAASPCRSPPGPGSTSRIRSRRPAPPPRPGRSRTTPRRRRAAAGARGTPRPGRTP